MLRVALTGGMGSGKSVAAAMFAELGCFVSQSDEVARGMMQPGEPVYRAIVKAFGQSVVLAGGSLDRRALAQAAFHDGRLEELNAIVHPAVIARQAAWTQEIEREHPRAVAMVESALVFETKHGPAGANTVDAAPWRTRFDRVVLLTAAEDRRVERYLRRVGASSTQERETAQADALSRLRAQMPDAEKERLSDFVVQNNGTLEELRTEVCAVHARLKQEAEDRAEESM